MCLAIPMRLVERQGETGTADANGVRVHVGLALCPEAQAGDWLIVHAGFALTILDETEAVATRDLLSRVLGDAP